MFSQQLHSQNLNMASRVDDEPDPADEPVVDLDPAAILISLVHARVEVQLGDDAVGDRPLPPPPPLADVEDTGKNVVNVTAVNDSISPAKRKRVYDMSHLQKKSKKHCRHRGGGHQKKSATWQQAAAQVGDDTLTPQQVRGAVASVNPPGNHRGRWDVKRSSRGVQGQTKATLLRSNAALRSSYSRLSGFYKKRGERITELKKDNVDLGVQIRREKKASEQYLNSILADADKLRSEAADLKSEANDIKMRAEAVIIDEQRCSSDAMRQERAAASASSKRVRDRQAAASRAAADLFQADFKKEREGWAGKNASLEKKLSAAHAEVLCEREMWLTFREELLKEKALLEKKCSDAKYDSRQMMQAQLDKAIEVEGKLVADMKELTDWTHALEKDNKKLERERKKSRRAAKHWRERADKAVGQKEDLKADGASAAESVLDAAKLRATLKSKDEVIEKYKELLRDRTSSFKPTRLKKRKKKGKRGGAGSWDEYVTQMVCELLVLGVPPNVIPGNIMMMYESLLGESPTAVPSSNFARECRDVVRIACETLTAMKLANSPCWRQVFTDATTKRQQSFQTLIIGVGTDGGAIDPVIISSCIFLEDESAETTFSSINDKILALKPRLTRLREIVKEQHPGNQALLDSIQSEDGITTKKLEDAWFTTDNCAAARKVQRLAEDAWKSKGQNCWNHLRNTWINGMEQATNTYLKSVLTSSLDECDPKLRVKMLFGAFCRAFDKAFSLSANYPKGFGENFLEYMLEHHPTFALYHVARCRGARMDMILEAAVPIYMNRVVCIEYLDYCLKMVGKKSDNILMRNLWVLLSSSEMVAQTRLYGIMYFSICVPMRWLSGKSHEMKDFPVGASPGDHWCAKSMGKVADELLKKVEQIIELPSLFLSEMFMMSIFAPFAEELPPFKEYLHKYFVRKQMRVVNKTTGMRVHHIAEALAELFNPVSATNNQCTPRMLELVVVAMKRLRDELLDERKATYYNLSISGHLRSFEHCSKEDRISSRGCMTTNDLAESGLGGVSRSIEVGGMIGIHRAASAPDMSSNGFLNRGMPTQRRAKRTRDDGPIQRHNKRRKSEKGMFFLIQPKLQRCVFIAGMRGRHAIHVQDLGEIKAQRREKREKEKIAAAKGLDKSQGLLIQAIYRHAQFWSKACVKGDVRQVDRILSSLTTVTARRRFLRSNIEMRTLGLGGIFAVRYTITWSEGGDLRSIEYLARHLKKIMKEEQLLKKHIPKEPPTMLPKRRVTPIVGTLTEEVRVLDRKYFSNVAKFREDADVMRRELEKKGNFSLYSKMQPEEKPSIKNLVKHKEKIDVLSEMWVGEGKNTMRIQRWCQGTVEKLISAGDGTAKNPPKVSVMWEGLPNVQGWEKGGLMDQELKNHLYNKCKAGAWRLYVDIEEVRNVDMEENDGEDEAIEAEDDEAGEEVVVGNGENDSNSSGGSESDAWTSSWESESEEGEKSDEEDEWLEA